MFTELYESITSSHNDDVKKDILRDRVEALCNSGELTTTLVNDLSAVKLDIEMRIHDRTAPSELRKAFNSRKGYINRILRDRGYTLKEVNRPKEPWKDAKIWEVEAYSPPIKVTVSPAPMSTSSEELKKQAIINRLLGEPGYYMKSLKARGGGAFIDKIKELGNLILIELEREQA